MLLLFADGARLNCVTARHHHETCLNSTVAALESRRGIKVSREWVRVPNAFGGYTRVKDYWLEGADLDKARQLTAKLRAPEITKATDTQALGVE